MLSADPAGACRFEALRTQLAQLAPAEAAPVLREMANSVRRDDLHMVYRAKLGHLGGDFSVADILVTLYAAVLNVDPMRPLLAGL
jgi:transketolase